MSARLVGLYGSHHGDKEGLLGVLDYLGPAAETSLVSVGRIGLFGSGRVDRQGLMSLLDYLGLTAETSVGHLG